MSDTPTRPPPEEYGSKSRLKPSNPYSAAAATASSMNGVGVAKTSRRVAMEPQPTIECTLIPEAFIDAIRVLLPPAVNPALVALTDPAPTL